MRLIYGSTEPLPIYYAEKLDRLPKSVIIESENFSKFVT